MKKALIAIVLCLAVFTVAGAADATVIKFGDSSIFWPGWGNGSADDHMDSIVRPLLAGGEIEILNGFVTRVAISGTDFRTMNVGDLFLSTDGDTIWDYVVRLSGTTAQIYSISLPLNANGYVLVQLPETVRQGHPYAILDSYLTSHVGDGTFTGVVGGGDPGPRTWEWSLGTNYVAWDGSGIVGWTVATCANDVIYEKIPEPATMLLLGLSLIGLGVVRGRFKNI